MNNLKVLAGVSSKFTKSVTEAVAQTATGEHILNKYQAYILANPISCGVVNQFLQEANNCMYDNGIAKVAKDVSNAIAESKVSWALASVCESISADGSKYNYLVQGTTKQITNLLEQDESDVVSYVKAGALKNVMWVPAFRNIAKSVYSASPIVESFVNFKDTHPVSLIETKDIVDESTKEVSDIETKFEVFGHLYMMNESGVKEIKWNDVDNEFVQISRLFESNLMKCNTEDGTISLPLGQHVLSVNESMEGKCIRTTGENKYEYTVEQLRDFNNQYCMNIANPQKRNEVSNILECFAKVVENIKNISILNNVHIIESANDKLVVIESANPKSNIAYSLYSNHNTPWTVTNEAIDDVVNYISNKTKINLNEAFKDKMSTILEQKSDEEKQKIQEQLEADKNMSYKKRIEALVEKFKNDPTKLAILSSIALDLNETEGNK